MCLPYLCSQILSRPVHGPNIPSYRSLYLARLSPAQRNKVCVGISYKLTPERLQDISMYFGILIKIKTIIFHKCVYIMHSLIIIYIQWTFSGLFYLYRTFNLCLSSLVSRSVKCDPRIFNLVFNIDTCLSGIRQATVFTY